MKEVLTDRIVVEFKSEPGTQLSLEFIANVLRDVAANIEEGRSGDNYTENSEAQGIEHEILWEHESNSYGGFRIVSDKPLISQFIYHSELAPRIISEESAKKVRKWNEEIRRVRADGEYKFTDGDMIDKAIPLMKDIEEESLIII